MNFGQEKFGKFDPLRKQKSINSEHVIPKPTIMNYYIKMDNCILVITSCPATSGIMALADAVEVDR